MKRIFSISPSVILSASKDQLPNDAAVHGGAGPRAGAPRTVDMAGGLILRQAQDDASFSDYLGVKI
jgi:hypothetical protein